MLSDLLLWNKIGRIVTLLSEQLNISSERALDLFYTTLLSEQLNISSERALDLFYTSKTCELLHDPSTLLYTFSDGYIVDDVLREIQK